MIVQAILDGHHLADETARVVWRAAAGRVALVTDAVAATGPSGGRAQLGELELLVRDGVVRREDGVLAGSVLTMFQAVRNLHLLDVPLLDAVAAATSCPRACWAARISACSAPAVSQTWSCWTTDSKCGPYSLREASGSPPETRTNRRRGPQIERRRNKAAMPDRSSRLTTSRHRRTAAGAPPHR